MGNLLIFIPRQVKARGLKQNDSFKEKKLDSYLFKDDFQRLKLLSSIHLPLPKPCPTIFYPACGVDLLYILLFLEKIYPNLHKINLIFNDLDDNLAMFKTLLDDLGISFAENKQKKQANIQNLQFYWKKSLVNLDFLIGNVFTLPLPSFDIYFERAFRIMKNDHPEYEQKIFQSLNSPGLLISDSGFNQIPLQRFKVSPDLSSYGEMVIGLKK